jgi:CBS-domain-containing membrane protein
VLALGPKPTALPADAPVRNVLRAMFENRTNHIPLVNAAGRYVGLASLDMALEKVIPASATAEHGLRDLAFVGDGLAMLQDHLRNLLDQPAASLINPNAQPLSTTTPLMEAALLLSRSAVPLPVLDEHGNLAGMLSQRALMQFLADQGGAN